MRYKIRSKLVRFQKSPIIYRLQKWSVSCSICDLGIWNDIAFVLKKMANYVNSLDNPSHKCHFEFVEILAEKKMCPRQGMGVCHNVISLMQKSVSFFDTRNASFVCFLCHILL